ncbi:hypothetical protein NEIMUCOT_06401 [Neisseria mucosa ATCC 25996]|uniref:Uncharacterized protein n=1 Tax=Neisseria mucosa (strain ATCC 25996 / DSM 4631 / NCTC 10774 / M26) TaxID=546266 RepID=D3A0G6_NEIM2|nr:hypothetical protein NEIMUCOT_06401 [Neisseria mucosa ATCC 25996]
MPKPFFVLFLTFKIIRNICVYIAGTAKCKPPCPTDSIPCHVFTAIKGRLKLFRRPYFCVKATDSH